MPGQLSSGAWCRPLAKRPEGPSIHRAGRPSGEAVPTHRRSFPRSAHRGRAGRCQRSHCRGTRRGTRREPLLPQARNAPGRTGEGGAARAQRSRSVKLTSRPRPRDPRFPRRCGNRGDRRGARSDRPACRSAATPRCRRARSSARFRRTGWRGEPPFREGVRSSAGRVRPPGGRDESTLVPSRDDPLRAGGISRRRGRDRSPGRLR